VRQETDGSGNVITTRGFDPYGMPLQGNGGIPFGFTGEQTDSTGLVFLRARYMQPTLGMFLSHDAWQGDAFRPLTYNGWSYVEGNPLNRTDPNGHCDGCDRAAFVTIIGANADSQGGLAFRSYPGMDAPVHFRMKDGSVVMLSGSKRVANGEVWRYAFSSPGLGTFEGIYPWEGGWVRDKYLEVGGDWSTVTNVPANATAYPPHYQLRGFRLSAFFADAAGQPSTLYNIETTYGENGGWTDFLHDLQRTGHNGVDVVSTTHSDPCTGRNVIAPVSGFVSASSPDYERCDEDGKNCTHSEPATNPPGRTLSFTEISGYSGLMIQLTHVSGDKAGQVDVGDVLGHYAQIGYSYGPHLHISFLWQDYDDKYFVFDPTRYLP